MTSNSVNINIQIKGLVQGVGFRPFVYNTAVKNNVAGWVKNSNDGVLIQASGTEGDIKVFLNDLSKNQPPASCIYDFQISDSKTKHKDEFQIILSDTKEKERDITQIGPDIAVCTDCLEDMKIQNDRVNYPFINCTNCGPRFSIIQDLPYDRHRTTMKVFEVCQNCKTEYDNPLNRRFHAQPIACLNCGPHYTLNSATEQTEDLTKILAITSDFIDRGKTVAIKGIGGFFIACDATNRKTVKRLRHQKNREAKPFAVMFRDNKTVKKYCSLYEEEYQALNSWQRPIVILKSKNILPQIVSNKINTVGALLPYMPFHYLLFEKLKTSALIFTSGNFSDEPIVISNKQALNDLGRICDLVVSYNRKIYNRTDDSLLQIINNKSRQMRRSRGYAPNPVYLDFDVDGILATGAELKNTFCAGKGKQAILSQHIGDLKDFKTYSFYERNIQQFQKMFRLQARLMVTDLHPEYLSTKYAFETQLPVVRVQHHHAHIASAMAENGLNEEVIGVSFDGTGLGDDGHIWGSEFFICDLKKYERKLHFEYIPLPGGDSATKEPWKIALSWLYKTLHNDFRSINLPLLKNIPEDKIEWVIKSIQNNINCPLSSGSGRLFDAVSALLGLCTNASFEAEAPMRLESAITKNEHGIYSHKLSQVIEFSEMFTEIIYDIKIGVDVGTISAKFHNTVSELIIKGVKSLNEETNLAKVVLSGGTFQNRYLLERTEKKLTELGFDVFGNCSIPCNDGGISLGQLAIAAQKRY